MQDISRTTAPCLHSRHILQDSDHLRLQSRWRSSVQKDRHTIHGEFHENTSVQHSYPATKPSREGGGETRVDSVRGRPTGRTVAFCCVISTRGFVVSYEHSFPARLVHPNDFRPPRFDLSPRHMPTPRPHVLAKLYSDSSPGGHRRPEWSDRGLSLLLQAVDVFSLLSFNSGFIPHSNSVIFIKHTVFSIGPP